MFMILVSSGIRSSQSPIGFALLAFGYKSHDLIQPQRKLARQNSPTSTVMRPFNDCIFASLIHGFEINAVVVSVAIISDWDERQRKSIWMSGSQQLGHEFEIQMIGAT